MIHNSFSHTFGVKCCQVTPHRMWSPSRTKAACRSLPGTSVCMLTRFETNTLNPASNVDKKCRCGAFLIFLHGSLFLRDRNRSPENRVLSTQNRRVLNAV